MSFSDIRRTQPLEVKVFEICPRCDKLQENVKERVVIANWGLSKFKFICCQVCFPTAEAEFKTS